MGEKASDKILALDPGSVRCGWAVLDEWARLLEGGVLKPDKVTAEPHFRIASLCRDLLKLLYEIEPSVIVIEITSGKVGRKRHKGGGAGLAVYGMAVGALWREAVAWREMEIEYQGVNDVIADIVLVTEIDWCRGVPKGERMAAIAAQYPKYNIVDDPGGDLADAIGLGCWYIREQRMRIVEQVK